MPAESPRDLLQAGCAQLGVAARPDQLESLLNLSQLLFRWSKRINLTGHRSETDIIRRLVLDAIALAVHIPEVSSLVDIGSGAGFPGFPIAILRRETHVVLIESRQRRHHFQREVTRALSLGNVEVMLGRAEQLEGPRGAAAIAQAIAPSDAIGLMLRWVEPGGLLLFPGSENSESLPPHPGVILQDCVEYQVPCGGPRRLLRIAQSMPTQ